MNFKGLSEARRNGDALQFPPKYNYSFVPCRCWQMSGDSTGVISAFISPRLNAGKRRLHIVLIILGAGLNFFKGSFDAGLELDLMRPNVDLVCEGT